MKWRKLVTSVGVSVLLGPLLMANPAQAANAVFHAGTLNIYEGLTNAQFTDDLNLMASRADMIGLNEVGARKDRLQEWADAHGWWLYAPGGSQQAAEALLAKKSMFNFVNAGSYFACDTNGPGEVPPARYNNWAHYVHKPSGRTVFQVNIHANASIEENGHPVDIPRTQCAELQFQIAKDQASYLAQFGEVILTGDLNVDYSADRNVGYPKFPWAVYESGSLPGLRSVYNTLGVKGAGTHGNRHIDYVYFWRRWPANQIFFMTDYSIVSGTNSDHDGVVAKFSITKV